ncbi:TetR family transcriptional regulator [Streptomyces sp. NPDC094038]|uniref:TetR family transcriptional regulator n=1 Tax=Streptomyces sp. NPDC094038 TaxID=3366055 RepID=UPI00382B6CE3
MGEMGLRERKRRRMYEDVSDVAVRLFLAKGFDAVSVAEVAAAAGISKPTLFRYFPAKEDLVLHRIADHETEAARLVAGVAGASGASDASGASGAGSPVGVLRARFLSGLAHNDPITGLNDHPQVLAFHTLLNSTPTLVARQYAYLERSEAALAEALGGTLEARLAAGQIIAVQRILAQDNWRRIAAGERVEDVREDAVRAAEEAFGRLERTLAV